MKILALVVVYNEKISDSVTYQKLRSIQKSIPELKIVIADNSTQKFLNNRENINTKRNTYIDMKGNIGLSRAYNKVIDIFSRLYDKNDILVLFDDDTDININYFKKLKKIAGLNEEVDIFAPIVKGQDGIIYSPNSSNFLKNHLIAGIADINKIKKFNAISSCLAIRFRVFDTYRFNESLFMDEVDQKFCEDQRNLNRKFEVIDVFVNQSFHQRKPELVANNFWPRFKIRVRDIMMYGKLKGKHYIFLAFVKSNLLGLQFAIKTKDKTIFYNTFKLSKSYL